MASFEKVLFLQAIEKEAMTIRDICNRYEVSANTARQWVKHQSVKIVPGPYPYQYTHKDNHIESPAVPSSEVKIIAADHSKCLKLHEVTNDQLDKAIESTLVAKTTVGEILSSITNQAELDSVEARLISLVQIARRYYERDVKD